MYIAKCVNEVANFKFTNLCNHHRQQSIGSNIEWNSQKYICTALVKLATQLVISHIKLEHRMAGHQSHLGQICYVPCIYNQSPAVGIFFNLVDHVCNLVNHY